jgi:signal peptidase I
VFANPVRPDGAVADPRWLVKRVTAVAGDAVPEEVRPSVGGADSLVPVGALVVRGDAERSQDSRHFGFVLADSVLGTVVRTL